MGACLGTDRLGGDRGDVASGGSGSGRRPRRQPRSSRRRASNFSDSTSSGLLHATKNRHLRHEKIRWKSDIPLTEGQLKSKRDEFWDTAPAFEGKPEIWAALKAATEATELSEPDFELAQAILDGACISLPHGSLVECYDELGTRYAIPVYCLSYPINIVTTAADKGGDRPDSPAEFSVPVNELSKSASKEGGKEMRIRVRYSLHDSDVRLTVYSRETVLSAKRRLALQEKAVPEASRQRWYFAGRMLGDKTRLGDAGIPSGHVVQCIVNNLDFEVIKTKD